MKKLNSILSFPFMYRLFIKMVTTEEWRLTYVNKYIRSLAGDRILDIGCGTADILDYLPDVQYYGFDKEKRYIDAAIKKFSTRGTFVCMNVSSDAIKNISSFDIAIAKGVVHHLDDEEALQLFELARKALRPEGRLITIDICYIEGRSKLEYFLLSRDRGQYVRNKEGYYHLAAKVFPNVQIHIHHNYLRIPYTHIIMECSL